MPIKLLFCFILLFQLSGTAQISFQHYSSIPTGSSAEVIGIADFNGDGLNDIILGNAFYFDPGNDYTLKLFIQNQNGTLNQALTYPYSSSAERIEALCLGDLDQDGRMDIILGVGNKVKVFYQNQGGGLSAYQEFQSGQHVTGIGFGDLNNDGRPDFVASHWNENYIRVFLQHAGGFNSYTYPKPQGGYDELKVADMNNDGLDDVVFMAGQITGGVHIYLQNNSGTLQNISSFYPTETSWNSLAGFDSGDLNNNGKTDMVASMGGNSPTSKMVLWTQQGSNNMISNPPISISAYDIPEPVKISDLNCDGKNEILTVHGGWGNISVYESDSNYQFSNYQKFGLPYASHYNPYGLALGDINNDNKKDIVIADYNNGLVLLYNNTPIPEKAYKIKDTIISKDTTYLNFQDSVVWIVNNQQWEQNKLLYSKTDSIKTIFQFKDELVRERKIYIKSGVFCNKNIADSTLFDTTYSRTILNSYDTIFVKSNIDSINNINKVTIYPNPNHGYFQIDLPSPYDSKSLYLKIYNHLGQLVLYKNIDPGKRTQEIKLYGVSEGNYFIKIFDSSTLIAEQKMVIVF